MDNNGMKERLSRILASSRAFLEKRGFYIVLMSCVAVVGVAAALAFGKNRGEETPPAPTPTASSKAASSSRDEHLGDIRNDNLSSALAPTPSPTDAGTPIPDFTPAPAKTTKPRTKCPPPVPGKVVWGFAINELIYSKTLDQWMTHPGVDVGAPKGTPVYAVYGGTVNRVYEDDALGFSVEVACANGMTAVYANLKADPPVREGQRVSAGDTLGEIGSTAVSECGIESHLHFELHASSGPVDPNEYVLFARDAA